MINLLGRLIVGYATFRFMDWLFDEEEDMFDCSAEISKFHNERVTLPESIQKIMRERRNANRDRLEAGLEKNDKPQVEEFVSQGSYAMRTMVQTEGNDIDIDDGAYFAAENLKNSNGSDMTPRSVREMIWEILSDKDFKKPPEIKDNCVRIFYNEGYQVDIPAYRKVVKSGLLGEDVYYELASKDQWRRSDPRAVTEWFKARNKEQSPDGEQMRRVVRLLKDFVQSDPKWKGKGPSGFIVTKLVDECYAPYDGRDDQALYYTMRNIRDRLNDDLEVEHPVPEIDENLTKGPNDSTAEFFRDRLDDALKDLEVLLDTDDADEALSAWGDVFSEKEYFEKLAEDRQEPDAEAKNNVATPSIWVKSNSDDDPPAVKKQGGGRYG